MNSSQKILIISVKGGFGHIRAGQALQEYAQKFLPELHVEHIDIAHIHPFLLERFFGVLYDLMSKKFPKVWKLLYTHTAFFIAAKKIIAFGGLFDHKIKTYIANQKPDAIIFTNAIIMPMVITSCGKLLDKIPKSVVVTDFHGHPYYYFKGIYRYFVATEAVRQDLQRALVPGDSIAVTGIPVSPRFYVTHDVRALKAQYGFAAEMPVITCIVSFQVSKSEITAMARSLLDYQPALGIVIIANGNNYVYAMASEACADNNRAVVVRWTDSIEEYMAIADVIFTKAGGLTVSECLAMRKPMIVFRPIPGQEDHNARFIQASGRGVRISAMEELPEAVAKTMKLSLQHQMNLIASKNPSEKIFQHVLSVI
jgi:processive 1,2-diacylglycerol beta-glucosyltransferase